MLLDLIATDGVILKKVKWNIGRTGIDRKPSTLMMSPLTSSRLK
jgi:hypothetical protein